jgi:DNA polymerase-4
MQSKAKVIFHVDMNMFFCSVAVIKNPSLKGKAFVCGRANTLKGVVSTASYEARKYGIHSAMPMIEAIKRKPDLIVVESDWNMIKQYHNHFLSVLRDYTKVIEVASVDEAYCDMTEISKYRNPLEVAKEIQVRLVKEYHLPCSIGIAPTLFLAKMASDMKKPLGLVVIRKRDAYDMLKDLSVADIFGIGKKTYPILIENGIRTISDFLDPANKIKILTLVGQNTYDYVITHLQGNSSNVVMPNRYAKNESISTMTTFDSHISNESEILFELRGLTRELISRLNKANMMTKTISITLRDESFKTMTRSKTIKYTDDFYDIFDTVSNLLDTYYEEGTVLRLVGVGFSNLKDKKEALAEEYNLFTFESFIEREEKVKEMLKELQDKYGTDAIHIGIKKDDN